MECIVVVVVEGSFVEFVAGGIFVVSVDGDNDVAWNISGFNATYIYMSTDVSTSMDPGWNGDAVTKESSITTRFPLEIIAMFPSP